MKNLKWKNRKITRRGSNLAVHIPKKAQQVMELQSGMNATIEVIDENEIHIKLRDKR